MGKSYYWRVDLVNQAGTTTGDIWNFTMEKCVYFKADYSQASDSDGIVSIEVENFTANETIGEHTWTLLTDPSGLGPISTWTSIQTPNVLAIPVDFELYQNYPNPFNSGTIIKYSLHKKAHVRLAVYDILGREVTKLVDKIQQIDLFSSLTLPI